MAFNNNIDKESNQHNFFSKNVSPNSVFLCLVYIREVYIIVNVHKKCFCI